MSAVVDNLDIFWVGIKATLLLALLSGIGAMFFGAILAVMRVSPARGFRLFSTAYVEIVRNTPITIVFFFVAFVLPELGISLPYFTFGVIALIIYYTAFFCEALRSGFNSVPIGQSEAARSIGLTFMGSLQHVILPQALRHVVPPLINVVIALIKSTAVASAFGVPELLTKMEHIVSVESNAVISVLVATAVFYLIITVPAGLVANEIERRVSLGK